jgi:PAS domain S-box-containing protein
MLLLGYDLPMPLDQLSLIEAIAISPIAMAVSNPRRPDNPLEIVNRAFCDLTLYPESEILGRNCRFLGGEQTEGAARAAMRSAIADVRPVLTEVRNYRRDGRAFRNGVMITPLFDEDGKLAWFLGSQVDLGDSEPDALAERRLRAKGRVAELPLRQREVLERMARGLLNKQIAWDLKISEKTVKMHRALLLNRLGVATSAEAIRIAVEAGL